MRVLVTHLSGSRKGEREMFEEPVLTIGRARTNRVRLALNDTRASAQHAELRLERGQYILVDLGATNGTYVNGKRIARHRLRHGDLVTCGHGGPELRVEFFEKLPSERPSVEEPHEFPFEAQFQWWLWGTTCFLLGVVAVSVYFQLIVVAVPAGLAAAALFFLGLALARVNITIGPDGIVHENVFRTTRIKWPDVVALESGLGRTNLLHGTICRVVGRKRAIVFKPSDYVEGYLLARLIAEVTQKEWGAAGTTSEEVRRGTDRLVAPKDEANG